jgi:hypothetical protein
MRDLNLLFAVNSEFRRQNGAPLRHENAPTIQSSSDSKLNFELLSPITQSELARSPKKESTVKMSISRRVRNTAQHNSSISSGVALRIMQQTGSHYTEYMLFYI